MADVFLKGISKAFGDHQAIANLDLRIADGEFVVLLGPTGAGKTTTLRLIAGLEKPDAGTIHIGGRDATNLAPAERDVAFVFQQYSLYPHLSVFDNLAFPLRSPARRMPEDQIRRRVEDVARMVRISHKLDNRSTKLSGGEMQRVAIGRALVQETRDLSDGRAAVLARRQAARRTSARTQAHPGRARLDRALRHARPDRGDDHGRPHRHPGRRRAGADRIAEDDLHGAGESACRGAAWPAGDQPHSGRACCPTPPCRPARKPSARGPST